MKKNVVIIVGPTAVGKTALSIALAKKFNGEIISADSMQIYKDMNIGSAKPTATEMDGVKHYLIDEVDPSTEFSVSDYAPMALEYIDKITSEGKLPIVVGGTGLYVNSIMYEMDFSKSSENKELRAMYENIAAEHGNEYLYNILLTKDPKAAKTVHMNNVKRVIRALEIHEETGEGKKDFASEPQLRGDLNIILIGLTRNRKKLYARINKRVELMFEAGLLKEVENLKNNGLSAINRSMQGIGYKEVLIFANGKCDYDQMVSLIKQSSRRYAKRQMTWFKRYDFIKWFDYDQIKDIDALEDAITSHIRDNFI